jgi:transcriptional regulator with XRE-family HTH domain
MTDIRDLVAKNIKKYRAIIGLSQARLAEKVDTSTNYIALLETKRKFPSPEMLERLASALGIDTVELFYREIAGEDAIKMYRKAAIDDIQEVIARAIDEKLKSLG